MSIKVCYQDSKGQLITKYFNSERSLIDTLWLEIRKIDVVRKSRPVSENDLYLKREKYLLDLIDKYSSPQTKKEQKYWEEKAAAEKRLIEYDRKYLAPKRAAVKSTKASNEAKASSVAKRSTKSDCISTAEFLKIRREKLKKLDNQILRAANDPKKRTELQKKYEQEKQLIDYLEGRRSITVCAYI